MDMTEMFDVFDAHGFEDTDANHKTKFVNLVVQDICSREPWTFLEDITDVTIEDSQVILPDTFRSAMSLVIPAIGRTLTPERTDTILKNNPSRLSETGTPRQYYFVGQKLYVLPIPDTAYTGKLFFLKDHPMLTENSVEADFLIPPKHHSAIVDGTLVRLYSMEDDPENAGLFRGYYEQEIANMSDTWKRQYDLPDRVVDVWENGDGWC